MTRCFASCGLLAATLVVVGCRGAAHRLDLHRQYGGNAALVRQVAAYDAETGRRMRFDQVVQRCAAADVVFFGEEHNDPVCNQYQAQLLFGLLGDARPTALAMEFFETDTQSALDAYLVGDKPELEFRAATRQSRAYVLAHRPLIEIARAARAPVIAANAPRPLVRAYRLSNLPFAEYAAELTPQQRRWLPNRSEHLPGPYEERFRAVMQGEPDPARNPADAAGLPATPPSNSAAAGMPPAATQPTTATQPLAETQPVAASQPASQPAAETQPAADPHADAQRLRRFYAAQLLWDDAMAERVAEWRRTRLFDRVLLIIGGFHVSFDGGTRAKYRERRPRDRTVTIVYHSTVDPSLPLLEPDRKAGDIILYGVKPPPAPKSADAD